MKMIRNGLAAVLLVAGLPLMALSDQAGILVAAVDPDGPAAAAGIEKGDLIVSIDGQGMASTSDVIAALAAAEESQVTLAFQRGDRLHEQVVTLDRVWGQPRLGLAIGPAVRQMAKSAPREAAPGLRAFRVDEAPGAPGAVVMEVAPDSPAAGAGLQPGDWITAIGDESLGDSSEHLAEIIESYRPGDRVAVEFQRDGKAMTATVTLGANPDTGSALLGVRYRVQPFFGGVDMEDLRKLFDMLRERFERLQPAPAEADLEVPDSSQAL